MKSNLSFAKEDDDLLRVSMKFTFESMKGPELRKKLEALGYKLYPMDRARLTVSPFAAQTGQANTSIRNEFVILRNYEIPEDFDQHVDPAKAHAERYFNRVLDDLKDLA